MLAIKALLPLLTVVYAAYDICGGHRSEPDQCPEGEECIDNPYSDRCGLSCDGPGICVEWCGGIAGTQCPEGKICIDYPDDKCDPKNSGADCYGYCVPYEFCGGFATIQCSGGLKCIDNPNDGCDPMSGGADCGGICV